MTLPIVYRFLRRYRLPLMLWLVVPVLAAGLAGGAGYAVGSLDMAIVKTQWTSPSDTAFLAESQYETGYYTACMEVANRDDDFCMALAASSWQAPNSGAWTLPGWLEPVTDWPVW